MSIGKKQRLNLKRPCFTWSEMSIRTTARYTSSKFAFESSLEVKSTIKRRRLSWNCWFNEALTKSNTLCGKTKPFKTMVFSKALPEKVIPPFWDDFAIFVAPPHLSGCTKIGTKTIELLPGKRSISGNCHLGGDSHVFFSCFFSCGNFRGILEDHPADLDTGAPSRWPFSWLKSMGWSYRCTPQCHPSIKPRGFRWHCWGWAP